MNHKTSEPSDTSAAPDVGEPFDWKAAWYALDRDNAALSTRVKAAEAEKEAMRVEIYETCAKIAETYDRPAFPGMAGAITIAKADIAHRIRKAAKLPRP